ncbi:X-linked lymphocyte-regulated protein PM1-like isoform X3 [Schistocerca nitens]|uniref:X-linked lymphocyte-regulated protein PM1-like isoform X3 n=1 Tax=Schistocerca nitens TaxID=7011 RepID=UPI00211790C0|nr:X-linked lymphocyte-regulated protein PM1-like isoform X3 [Schistocerca nitens]
MPKAGFKKAPFPQKKSAVSDTISDLSDDDLLESKPVKMPIKPMENVRPVRKRAAEDKYPIQADEDTLNLNLDDEVSKMLESFESGMQRALNAKRKRLQEFASGPIKVIQNKITQLWTAQREKRKIDLNDFQENVKKVRQKWESNLDNFKEEEKKLFTLLHRHMKAAKEKYDTMKENIEMLKQLHEDFFKDGCWSWKDRGCIRLATLTSVCRSYYRTCMESTRSNYVLFLGDGINVIVIDS